MITDEIREAVRQAAREAVWADLERDIPAGDEDPYWAYEKADILSGRRDHSRSVRFAISGALAAIAAAAPLIRAQCAEVELRDALRAMVDLQAKHFGDATALHLAMIEPAKQARAALARVEVSR